MLAVPLSLLDPSWDLFVGLVSPRPEVDLTHPLRCHRRRLPDRVVFEHVVETMALGTWHERIASSGCSDRTVPRRLHDWVEVGLMRQLHASVLQHYDRMISLELEDIAVTGCISTAPHGGEVVGRRPVDRGKRCLSRTGLNNATGVPLHVVGACTNRHDAPLMEPKLTWLGMQGGVLTQTTMPRL